MQQSAGKNNARTLFVLGLAFGLTATMALTFTPASAATLPNAVDSAETSQAPETGQAPRLTLNAFGTLGLAKSSQNRADYTFDNLQPFGVGRHRNPSPDIDSRLGAQITANITPQLSALLQVVSEYSWDGSYRPAVTWANVSYAAAPDLSLRLGRIGIASFMASDSRRVGYSNVTARPPIEVYRLLVLRESDGIDARIRFNTGDFKHDLSALYGRRTVINTRGQHVHSTDVGGLFDTIELGDFTFHLAVEGRHVDNQNPPLGMFYSLGAVYDSGLWFISSEWVRAVNYDAKGLKITREAAYALAGIHIDTLTPFASVSELRPRSDTGQPPVAQRSYAAGLRWDPMRHLDLKVQVDHIQLGSNSYGTLQNVAPGTPRGGSLNVLSLTLDFFY